MPKFKYLLGNPERELCLREKLLPEEFKDSGIDLNEPLTSTFPVTEIYRPRILRKRSVHGQLYSNGFLRIKELIDIYNELLNELSQYESYVKKDIECEKELEEVKIVFLKQNGSLLNRLFKKELLQELKQKLILIQSVLIDNKRKLDEKEKKLYLLYRRYNSNYNEIDEFLDDELFIAEKQLNQICTWLNIKIDYTNEKNFDREYAMKEAIKKALLIRDVNLEKFESINQKVLIKK